MLKKLTPNLKVIDVAETVKFYTEKLGFKLNMAVAENGNAIESELVKDNKYVYAMISRDEIFLMFIREDVFAKDLPMLKGTTASTSALFYCDVDNLDELYNSFKQKAVDIVKDLETAWYGMREFYIRDYNGYILGFAEKAG